MFRVGFFQLESLLKRNWNIYAYVQIYMHFVSMSGWPNLSVQTGLMNLARHRINKEKKELRSNENGLNVNWGNGLLSKYVHLAALTGKQCDISSLFFFFFFPSFHSLSHSFHSASYSRNGLYSSAQKAEFTHASWSFEVIHSRAMQN